MEIHQTATVEAFMTKHLFHLNPSDTLTKAQYMFETCKVKHLPVIDHRKVVGILTLNDLKKVEVLKDFVPDLSLRDTFAESITVDQVMTPNPVLIDPSTTVLEATQKLIDSEFNCLPIVQNEQLQGIVTTTDVLRYATQQIKRQGTPVAERRAYY